LETRLVPSDAHREIAGRRTRGYDLKIEFRGRRLDADGGVVERKDYAYAHRLWIAEELPYSPAFALPFRVIGRLFVEDGRSGLGEFILDRIRDDLRAKGLVLGMEFRRDGGEKPLFRMYASELRRAEEPIESLPAFPAVNEQVVAKFVPMTQLSRVIEPTDAAAVAASSLALTCGEKQNPENPRPELAGNAVFGVNQRGDFALLLRIPSTAASEQKTSDKEIFVLLMRPMHGLPGPGEYRVAEMPDEIESLSAEKLEKLSQAFTAIAVIREQAPDAKYPTIYGLWTVKSGKVTIAGPSDELSTAENEAKADKKRRLSLSGNIVLSLAGVKLGAEATDVTVEFRGTFTARQGLKNVGSSKITRVLQP
jgi:hypothetical protein